MRWELEEIKSSKYFLVLGPHEVSHLAKELLYWQLLAAKEGKVIFLLFYSHWQVCYASVNSTTPIVKLSWSPKQNTEVEAEP